MYHDEIDQMKHDLLRMRAAFHHGHPAGRGLNLPDMDLRIMVGLPTRDSVVLIVETSGPLPVVADQTMTEFLNGFNQITGNHFSFVKTPSAAKELDATNAIFVSGQFPFDEVINATNEFLSKLLFVAMPEAVLKAIELLKRIAAGESVDRVLLDYRLSVMLN